MAHHSFDRFRALAAAHPAVDLVAVQERAPAAAAGGESVGGHGEHGVEAFPREMAVRPRPTDDREQIVFGIVGARGLCDHLLGQHVERPVWRRDAIQLAAPDAANERGA